MADAALKEFVLNHHRMGQLNAELRQQRKAKREAKARLLTALAGATTALQCDGECIVVTITHAKRSTVSATDLAATADGLTPAEVEAAFKELAAETDMVALRDVVSRAVVLHLRAARPATAPCVKVKRADAKSAPVRWVAADSAEWRDAVAAATPKSHIEAQVAALRKRQRELSAGLQGNLAGAGAPDFQRPLYVHLDEGEAQFLLRNKPSVSKPGLNYTRLAQFLGCARNEQLDRMVSAATIDYSAVCALSRQMLPGVLTAIKEWQAKHATVSMQLQLVAPPGGRPSPTGAPPAGEKK